MRTSRVSSRSTCTRCALPRASYGETPLRRAIPSISTCGIATLSTPDLQPDSEHVFAEPWQAQAFALAVRLSAQGYFTWKEWAAALAEELKAAADAGRPDDGSHYYEHWLATLERLVTSKGLTGTSELLERKEAWADAYRHTPHGTPVVLRNRQ